MRKLFLIVGFGILSVSTSLCPQGLLERIESPGVAFENERKRWIGEDIFFLPQERAERLGKYIGFCWDPRVPRNSAADYSELVEKRARIEEAWKGRVLSEDAFGKSFLEEVTFWKMCLIHSDKEIWYIDDGASYILGAGFIKDYETARKHVGDSLWVKGVFVLYTMNDDGIIRLRNLQEVVLHEVRWGQYGNYPLQFILRTDDGQVGYRSGKNLEVFLDNWYRFNPRQKYRSWDSIYWDAIENRRVTSRMDPDMVVMAWGEPIAQDTVVTERGMRVMLWVYTGVRRTIYGLFFVDGKLVYWEWKERKHDEEEILRYELAAGQISVSCDVRINWRRMIEEGEDFVTFFW